MRAVTLSLARVAVEAEIQTGVCDAVFMVHSQASSATNKPWAVLLIQGRIADGFYRSWIRIARSFRERNTRLCVH